jgi:hypothetical protein
MSLPAGSFGEVSPKLALREMSASGGGTTCANGAEDLVWPEARQSDASDMACARDCQAAAKDINLPPDVFIFDRLSSQITPVSLGRHGPWMDESAAPAIDASGAVVVFTSRHPT